MERKWLNESDGKEGTVWEVKERVGEIRMFTERNGKGLNEKEKKG